MDPREALAQLGGVASTAELLAHTTRAQLRAALESGEVRRLTRGQ